jgi:hypothetical protein
LPSTIEKLHRERKDQRFTVLAVDIQESPERVREWVRVWGLTVPVVLDRDGAATAAYRVTATPTVVLIGRDGKMVARGSGTRAWTDGPGKALLDALVAAP